MGAAALALTSLEVAVRRRRGPLPRGQLVGVHAEAHRATGKAPLATELLDDLVDAFGLGLKPHTSRAGHDHQTNAVGLLLAFDDAGEVAQVVEPRVGARPHEDRIDRDLLHRGARGQIHVLEGALGCGALVRVVNLFGVRHAVTQQHALARVGAPSHEWLELVRVDIDLGVEYGALVSRQRLPVLDRRVPVGTLRGVVATLHILESGLVWRDHASARAGLDRHVADRHAAVHRERANRAAAVLEHVTLATTGADLCDHRKNDVFRGDASANFTGDFDLHGFSATLLQRLRSQDVFDFRGADTEGQRAECTMGCRV